MSTARERVAGDLRMIEVPTVDNGLEVLWAEELNGLYRVLSVPVFAYDLSRGAQVATHGGTNRLKLAVVVAPSTGATVRCYVPNESAAHDVHIGRILPDAERYGLCVGPATVFDPDIIAIHIGDREQVARVGTYLDTLVGQGVLRFWELGDPAPKAEEVGTNYSAAEPWELVHPLPVPADGQACTRVARH